MYNISSVRKPKCRSESTSELREERSYFKLLVGVLFMQLVEVLKRNRVV